MKGLEQHDGQFTSDSDSLGFPARVGDWAYKKKILFYHLPIGEEGSFSCRRRPSCTRRRSSSCAGRTFSHAQENKSEKLEMRSGT